jgi:DNA-binding transcriptional MerR regulator
VFVYTRTQICAHFGISGPTFQRYRAAGVIAAPKVEGKARYYSDEDIRRIRESRKTVHDSRLTFADYGLIHPHPASPQDRLRRSQADGDFDLS